MAPDVEGGSNPPASTPEATRPVITLEATQQPNGNWAVPKDALQVPNPTFEPVRAPNGVNSTPETTIPTAANFNIPTSRIEQPIQPPEVTQQPDRIPRTEIQERPEQRQAEVSEALNRLTERQAGNLMRLSENQQEQAAVENSLKNAITMANSSFKQPEIGNRVDQIMAGHARMNPQEQGVLRDSVRETMIQQFPNMPTADRERLEQQSMQQWEQRIDNLGLANRYQESQSGPLAEQLQAFQAIRENTAKQLGVEPVSLSQEELVVAFNNFDKRWETEAIKLSAEKSAKATNGEIVGGLAVAPSAEVVGGLAIEPPAEVVGGLSLEPNGQAPGTPAEGVPAENSKPITENEIQPIDLINFDSLSVDKFYEIDKDKAYGVLHHLQSIPNNPNAQKAIKILNLLMEGKEKYLAANPGATDVNFV